MKIRMRLSVLGVIRFFLGLVVLIYLWWFFRSYLFFIALLLMVVTALLGSFSLWSSRSLFEAVTEIPESRVGTQTRFPFRIRIANPRRFLGFTVDMEYSWTNVFTGKAMQKKEHMWLPPMKGITLEQQLISQYAGRIETKIKQFRVYDLLHLCYLEGCTSKDSAVIAYPIPTTSEDEEVYSFVEGFPKENETKKRGTDYNPDYEVREYIPGDELKNIHWKLSAKQDKLMVRERLASGRAKINVLLPLADEKEENDALISSLYDLIPLLLHKEYPVQLYWVGANNQLRSAFIAELGEAEAVIGEILSANGLHIPGSAKEAMEIEHPKESYIYVTTGAYKGAYIQ